jgi:hypothetical protein
VKTTPCSQPGVKPQLIGKPLLTAKQFTAALKKFVFKMLHDECLLGHAGIASLDEAQLH